MSKQAKIAVTLIAVIALCLSAVALGLVISRTGQAKDVQYVMYLGTNDKDTNKPVMSHEDAVAKVEEILLKHFGGYTIQDASGGWVDEGTVYTEYTLVIYLSDTTLDKVHLAADDMIKAFNQSSVLIQSNTTVTEFYSGSK